MQSLSLKNMFSWLKNMFSWGIRRTLLVGTLLILFSQACNTIIDPSKKRSRFCQQNGDCKDLGARYRCVMQICKLTEHCGGPDGESCVIESKQPPCNQGTFLCKDEKRICVPIKHRSTEICNNQLDDNCNGQVDESPPCTCVLGQMRYCYPNNTPGCEANSASSTGFDCKAPCRLGRQKCVPGVDGPQWGPCLGSEPPQREQCDNQDNDCDGQIDEDNPGGGSNCLVTGKLGPCADGKTFCKQGKFECKSSFIPSAEICDKQDNNCDGQIDEGCKCNPGDKQTCYTGSPQFRGKGICVAGEQHCDATGKWGACLGSVLPSEETCDGQDNDCDGQIDNHIKQLDQACAVKGQKGRCSKGKLRCQGGQLLCEQTIQPAAKEACDGIDDNCDGQIDEGCTCRTGTTRNCLSPTNTGCQDAGNNTYTCKGACKAGKQTCDANGQWGKCEGEVLPAAQEVCDKAGIDDNCDGNVDEGCKCQNNATQPCGSDVGACQKGTQTCKGGKWGTCEGEIKPSPELCNNIDDDCNGRTDETFTTLGQPCTVGQGACQVTGTYVCRPDGKGIQCDATPSKPTAELCDGIDNDCDGDIDEDFSELGQACSAGKGACKVNGVQICKSDGSGTICNATAKPPQTEDCDGKDNDCDGQIDNVPGKTDPLTQTCYSGPAGTDKHGICKAGTQTCTAGKWGTCVGEVTPAAKEACNNQDDNCDGQIDEGCTCVNGNTRSCFSGAGCALDSSGSSYNCQGICKAGTQTCTAGKWGTCTGEVKPTTETCNNQDDDCNGQIDDGIPPLPCYTGKQGTAGRGECKSGTQTCTAGNWGACIGEVKPTTETCNNKDDDCNGQIDDLTDLTCGQGVCQVTVPACKNGADNTCTPKPSPSKTEICDNNQDDNCDGKTDAADPQCCLPSVHYQVLQDGRSNAHGSDVTALDIQGDTLASSSLDNHIKLWSLSSRKRTHIHNYTDDLYDIALSPDGHYVAAAQKNKKLRIYKDNKWYDEDGASDKVWSLDFSPNSQSIVLVTDNKKLQVYSISKKKFISTYDHKDVGLSVQWSPDSKYWATGSKDHNAYLWDATNGKELKKMSGHTAQVNAVAFNKSGTLLATASDDKRVIIWNIPSGRKLSTLTHTTTVHGVAFSPDGVTLATAGGDGNARIWNFKTRRLLETLSEHTEKVTDVAYTADGKLLVTSSTDKTIRIWKCP